MKHTIFVLLLCSLTAAQGNNPSWSYTPMRTVGVFEGLEIEMHRPVSDFAQVYIVVRKPGQTIGTQYSHSVELKYNKDEDGKLDKRYGMAEFPMEVELDDLNIVRVVVVNGKYSLDITATKEKPILPAVNYVMEEK